MTIRRRDEEVFVGSPSVSRTVERSHGAPNGVIHQLDGVVYPELDVFDTALLRGLPDYVRAVRRAGLESLLRTSGSITVFGFTNAFVRATPDLLFHPDLAAILRYHAAPTRIAELQHGQVIRPFVGPDWTVYRVSVGGTPVFKLDSLVAVGLVAPATNGYVYSAQPDVLLVPTRP